MPLEWNGDEIVKKMRRVVAASINETTHDAAEVAQNSHPWVNRTGNLEGQIVNERAVTIDTGEIIGRFGYTYGEGKKGKKTGFYGLFLEKPAVHIRPIYKTIRPVGDAVFPRLREVLRRRFNQT